MRHPEAHERLLEWADECDQALTRIAPLSDVLKTGVSSVRDTIAGDGAIVDTNRQLDGSKAEDALDIMRDLALRRGFMAQYGESAIIYLPNGDKIYI